MFDIFDRETAMTGEHFQVVGLASVAAALLVIGAMHYYVPLRINALWDILYMLQLGATALYHFTVPGMDIFLMVMLALTSLFFVAFRSSKTCPCNIGCFGVVLIATIVTTWVLHQQTYILVVLIGYVYVTVCLMYFSEERNVLVGNWWAQASFFLVFAIHVICYLTQTSGYESLLQIIWVPGITWAAYTSLQYKIDVDDKLLEAKMKRHTQEQKQEQP